MNRQAKRDLKRHQDKAELWIRSLSPFQLKVLNEYSKAQYDFDRKVVSSQLDTCVSAALIENTELDLNEIGHIICRANYMLNENASFLCTMKNLEEYKMKLDQIAEEVENRIKQLLNEGTKQNEIVKIIKNEYKVLKSSHIQNAYKKVYEEWNRNEVDGDNMSAQVIKYLNENEKEVIGKEKEVTIKKIAKKFKLQEDTAKRYYYIWKKDFSGVGSIPKGMTKNTEIKKVDLENKYVPEKEEIKEEVAPDLVEEVELILSPGLEIISKNIVARGKFGNYLLSDAGLEVDGMKFKDIKEVDKYAKEEIAKIAERIQEYKSAFTLA